METLKHVEFYGVAMKLRQERKFGFRTRKSWTYQGWHLQKKTTVKDFVCMKKILYLYFVLVLYILDTAYVVQTNQTSSGGAWLRG